MQSQKYYIEGECEFNPEANQNNWYCATLNVECGGKLYIYYEEDHEQGHGNTSDLTYKIIEDAGLSAELLNQYPAGSIGANERIQRGENGLVRGEDLLPRIVALLRAELERQRIQFERHEEACGA